MTESLQITAIEIDGTVTRPLRFRGDPGEALYDALHEAMLKRGCLRDRAHKGQCMNCALLPRCAVWPLVAPADPTRRQRGPFLRPFVLRLPDIPAAGMPIGTRVTYGMTVVRDALFPLLWGAFADAFVRAGRQIAEWGFGLAVREGEKAARRGAISVGRARWLDPISGTAQPHTLAEEAVTSPPLVATFGPAEDPLSPDDALSLTFTTPTRLFVSGTALPHPTPAILVRRIAERLDAVADAVSAARPNLWSDTAFVEVMERITVGKDETRWVGDSARGGFVGVATLTGAADDLARIAPALRWGAALGVGKGTVQGFGRFVVGAVPPTARVTLPTEPAMRTPQTTAREKQRPPVPRSRAHAAAKRPDTRGRKRNPR